MSDNSGSTFTAQLERTKKDTGINSVGQECTQLKLQYDECFNAWFTRFLRGAHDDPCAPLFKVYQDCVKKAIKRQNIELWELEQDVLGSEKEQKPPPKKGNEPKH